MIRDPFSITNTCFFVSVVERFIATGRRVARLKDFFVGGLFGASANLVPSSRYFKGEDGDVADVTKAGSGFEQMSPRSL